METSGEKQELEYSYIEALPLTYQYDKLYQAVYNKQGVIVLTVINRYDISAALAPSFGKKVRLKLSLTASKPTT